jgi:hypothetical protein
LLITAGEVLTPLMRREISEAFGAPFSTICTVQGRMLDYSSLANGRLCHPYELVMLILDHGTRWIGQYQLTQERRNRVVLVESVYDGIDWERRCAALGSAAKRAQRMSARLHGTASRA